MPVSSFRVPSLSRRSLLRLSAAGIIGVAMSARGGAAMADIRNEFTIPIPDMSPYDIASLVRSQFTPEEQRITQYLVSLADIANNMEDTDAETVGWFNGGYSFYDPDPWNARLQESVYTLAWFYSHQAAWNPYYLDPVLRDHVYAAMYYYLKLQGPEGWFPAYSYTDKNRAATGFGLIYLGEAALMMESVGWDPDVRAEVLAGLQLAAEYILDPTTTDVWDTGLRYVNQIIGAMTGIAAILPLMPAHITTAYHERLDYLKANGQSQGAGFMYEYGAFDAHYSFYTALRDLAIGFERTGDDRYRQIALTHLDWCQYNYLWEPDGAGWTVNGISSRTAMRSLAALRTADTSSFPDYLNIWKESPVAVALNWHREHLQALQESWAAGDVPVTRLTAAGTAPSNLRLTAEIPVYPTLAERNAAIQSFPYFRADSFVEARSDAKFDTHYVFANRPGYYFGSHHGRASAPNVRRGPSFFYHHTTGAFVATQMTTNSAWATILPDGFMDAKTHLTSSGAYNQTLPFAYTYTDSAGRVAKTFTCKSSCLHVAVSAPAESSFVERIPLVIGAGDEVSFLTAQGEAPVQGAGQSTALGVRVRRLGAIFDITVATSIDMSLAPSTTTLFSGAAARVITELDLHATSSALEYKLHIH